MKRCLFVLAFLFSLVSVAHADVYGEMLKAGIDTDGSNVKINGGYTQTRVKVISYTTTTTARTVTQNECHNTVFITGETSDDATTFNLPNITSSNIGMVVTFIDLDATSGAKIVINPDDSDKINGGTAGVSYDSGGTALGECVTLVAVDASNWYPISKIGTWAAGS